MNPVEPVTAAPPVDGPGGFLAVVLIMAALIVILALAVRLHDLKRKREDEAVSLQARISDALLVDPMFAGSSLTATAHIPLWRGPGIVEITGSVPRPDLRESAVQLVMREMSRNGTNCRIEDRIVVDPILLKRAA